MCLIKYYINIFAAYRLNTAIFFFFFCNTKNTIIFLTKFILLLPNIHKCSFQIRNRNILKTFFLQSLERKKRIPI